MRLRPHRDRRIIPQSRDTLDEGKVKRVRIKVNDFRAFLLAMAMVQSVCTTANAGEEAARFYRSRYMLAGFLTRASAVCASDKKSLRRFLNAGLGSLGTPELRAISKAYPSTTGQWMKEGGETFNSRVMSDGVGSACAYAIAESCKAEEITRQPLPQQPPSGDDADSVDNLEYTVSFKGTCKYKFLNRTSFFPCDPTVRFQNFTSHRSAFTFTVQDLAIFIFSGGKDRQPNLENYFLSVDNAKFAQSGKGVQGKVEGECHMRMNKDGSKYYEIECDVFDRKTGLIFNFYLTEISDFERQGS